MTFTAPQALAVYGGHAPAAALIRPSRVVQIESQGHTCSAEVVGPRHLLTAAHCVDELSSFDRIGLTNIESGLKQKLRIATIILHPNYRYRFKDHAALRQIGVDLAVLALALPLGSEFQISKLISAEFFNSSEPIDTVLVANGSSENWRLSQNLSVTAELEKMKFLAPLESLDPEFYVYKDLASGGGPCEGDSGGGLFLKIQSEYFLFAIQSKKSADFRCGDPRGMGYAASILDNLYWIQPALLR